MAMIARRKATVYGRWQVEWKHGALPGGGEPVREAGAMDDDLLATFFSRYPSALGTTHAGGQYRLICPSCGHLVPVAIPREEAPTIHVHCTHCDYDDVLAPTTGAAAED